MAYKALYRTYRPQNFFEVIGQDVVVTSLKNAIKNDKISHAYLFSGPRGTGKTTVARILAKALNCVEPINSEPCGVCTSCLEIAGSISPDVVEIDAASNNGVDEIREIRDKVRFLPSGVKYKIYIIDEVHMLTSNAFNALLKTLEEPPKHVIFVLATTESHKVPTTILSRCQRYDFKTLSITNIAKNLRLISKEEKINISDEALIAIGEAAEGAMRDAQSILDQAISFSNDEVTVEDINTITGNISYNKIIELAQCFEAKDANNALRIINEIINLGKEVNKVINNLLQFYRDILLYKNIDTKVFSRYIFEKEEFKKLAATLSEEKVLYNIDVLSDVQAKIRFSTTPRTYLEIASVRIINVSLEELNFTKRISTLEEKLNNVQVGSAMEMKVNNDIDSEKVNMIELKISRVINELSKLEIPKIAERVGVLEARYVDSIKQVNDEGDWKGQIQGIVEELQILKGSYNSIQNQITNIKLTNNPVSTDLTDKLSGLEEKIDNFEAMIRNDKEMNLASELEKIKSIMMEDYNRNAEIIGTLKSEIRSIKTVQMSTPEQLERHDVQDIGLADLKNKLSDIETKVYKLISNDLAQQTTTKKTRKRFVNANQIVLFGDDLIAVEDIDKQPVKEKIDFSIYQKPQEETLEVKYTTKEASDIKEDIVINDITNDDSIVWSKEVYEGVDGVTVIDTTNSRIMRKSTTGHDEQENSELENLVESNTTDLFKDEQIELNEEVKRNLNSQVDVAEPYEPDEYSLYDAKVVQRILDDSRTEIAKNDKERLVSIWKILDKSVEPENIPVARLLQDGTIVAVGNKEMVLAYPNAALCNQVMRLKFKKESLKMLYDILGDTYNYMALPNDVWLAKRTEYINQYNIGISKPVLTPISDENLSVLKEDEEYVHAKEKALNQVLEMFGKQFVTIEE